VRYGGAHGTYMVRRTYACVCCVQEEILEEMSLRIAYALEVETCERLSGWRRIAVKHMARGHIRTVVRTSEFFRVIERTIQYV